MQFKRIRDLIKIYNNNFGVSENKIIAKEKKLGVPLPDGLKEYYKKFGSHNILIDVF